MAPSGKLLGAALTVIMAISTGARAQTASPMTDADLKKQAATADALYRSQNYAAALPLYEDLHQRQPESNVWRERLASSLLSVAGAQSQAEAPATRDRAHKLLLEAKAAGDNSNLLQVLLEQLETSGAPAAKGPESPAKGLLDQAEKAFSRGDLPGAMDLYRQAAAADPKLYEAPLFAGDTEFKQGHYVEAGQWFAKAIAIDPDRETAYRYWGDSLIKQGDPTRAKGKFIDAIVAAPYTRATRVGLKQWADLNKAVVMAPAITMPAKANITPTGNGGMTVGIDPAVMAANKDSPMLPAVMAYMMGGAMWRSSAFHATYPTETQYRHSLAEEAQSIRVALSTLTKANLPLEKMNAPWRTLAELDKDGMLECWILLDHPDQGIAQDYATYRSTHRELLHEYIAKYDVHPK